MGNFEIYGDFLNLAREEEYFFFKVPVAGSGLPGAGRTTDGYPHATSSVLAASSFARCLLNWYALTSLVMICPSGMLISE